MSAKSGPIKVTIKWMNAKQDFKEVELDADQEPVVFKSLVYSLTNVLPERQKIMFKGKTLGDSWSTFPTSQLKNGVVLSLMGSAEELPPEPAAPVIFEEDLSEIERAQLVPQEHPPGFPNPGTNVCYFNSAVQLIASVPELRGAAAKFSAAPQGPAHARLLVTALGRLMQLLQNDTQFPGSVELTSTLLWSELRKAYPQFDQKSEQGGWMQHDSEECLQSLLNAADNVLDQLPDAPAAGASAVQQLFGLHMQATTRCLDNPDAESPVSEHEHVLMLKVHIDGKTNFLREGLQATLAEQLDKNSPVTGLLTRYERQRKVTRLPRFLLVHFVRFLWKQQAETKAKILRPVDFPDSLDLYDICTPDHQKRLMYKRRIDEKNNELAAGGKKSSSSSSSSSAAAASSSSATDDDVATEPTIVDPYECDSGMYELWGVVSHKGRSADGGHYVYWTRNPKSNNWLLFDDDRVSEHPATTIRKLTGHGGADDHIAYICLYRAKTIEPAAVPVPTTDDA